MPDFNNGNRNRRRVLVYYYCEQQMTESPRHRYCGACGRRVSRLMENHTSITTRADRSIGPRGRVHLAALVSVRSPSPAETRGIRRYLLNAKGGAQEKSLQGNLLGEFLVCLIQVQTPVA
jgi:hypothetical protein